MRSEPKYQTEGTVALYGMSGSVPKGIIEEVVHECLTIAGERAQSKGIDLENNLTSDLPPLNADRLATKQILLNLLSNAVKFTPEGGKVTILTTASKNEVHFQIVDTGIGISSEKQG